MRTGPVNPTDEKRRYWLDDPRHLTVLYRVLVAVCLALAGADFILIKTGHLAWERWAGFHPLYGFVAYLTVVYVGKALRGLVGRREDYYDR